MFFNFGAIFDLLALIVSKLKWQSVSKEHLTPLNFWGFPNIVPLLLAKGSV